jgi:hypothetical protein
VRILASSKEYLRIPIDPPDGVTDVTAYIPEACLVPDDGKEPGDDDWQPATWIGGECALLIGPGGGIEYLPGDYMAFAAISAGAERIVMPSGRVRIGM